MAQSPFDPRLPAAGARSPATRASSYKVHHDYTVLGHRTAPRGHARHARKRLVRRHGGHCPIHRHAATTTVLCARGRAAASGTRPSRRLARRSHRVSGARKRLRAHARRRASPPRARGGPSGGVAFCWLPHASTGGSTSSPTKERQAVPRTSRSTCLVAGLRGERAEMKSREGAHRRHRRDPLCALGEDRRRHRARLLALEAITRAVAGRRRSSRSTATSTASRRSADDRNGAHDLPRRRARPGPRCRFGMAWSGCPAGAAAARRGRQRRDGGGDGPGRGRRRLPLAVPGRSSSASARAGSTPRRRSQRPR